MQKIFKRFLTFVLASVMCLGITAVVHTVSAEYIVADAAVGTYYNKITATGGEQLLGQLHDLIVTSRSKYSSYSECHTKGTTTDPGSKSNTVMEFYTHQDISYDSWDVNGGWNREHVWPKADSNGLWKTDTVGGGSDLHHIRPAEKDLNAKRGNLKYGEVSNGSPVYQYGTSYVGGYSSGSTFEPMDNVKGDVARILMYVYTHYNTFSNSIFGGYATTDGSSVSGYSASFFGTLNYTHIITASNEAAAKKLLLEWNKSDPVDEIETKRNEAVYGIQKNRNPFIDHPEYADAIWGDGSTVTPPTPTLTSIAFDASAFTLDIGQSRTLTVIPTPSNVTANVNWTSSNTSVATVSNGVVTAKGEGTATITATSTSNSSIKTAATVTVKKASTPPPTPSGTFEAGTYKMALNITASDITKKLYFTGALNDNNYGLTTEDADKAAEVVAAKADDGYTLKVGDKYLELEASTNSNGGTISKIVLVDRSTGEWTYDSDLNVLTWTLTMNGKSYYLGTYTNSTSGKTYETISSSETKYISDDNSSNVGVSQFPVSFEKYNETPPTLVRITVDPSAITVKEGATSKLSVLSEPSTVTAEVNWTSSNTSVATVSADGTVTAVKAGTVIVTATSKTDPAITATATVTVTADTTVVIPPIEIPDISAFETAVNAIRNNGTLSARRTLINAAITEYAKLTDAGKAQAHKTNEYKILNDAINKLADDYNNAVQNAELIAIGGIL